MAQNEPRSGIKTALSWIVTVVIAVVAAFLIRTFVAEVYLVPSGSMLDTIQEGDRLIGEKISILGGGPHAGEVVTFKDPLDPNTTLIKRVIATEGQVVDLRDGKLFIDGVEQHEAYTEGKPTQPLDSSTSPLGEVSYPYTVPKGSIWVMGDNRTNSKDSRYFGAVKVSAVTSHAVCIFWPFSDMAGL